MPHNIVVVGGWGVAGRGARGGLGPADADGVSPGAANPCRIAKLSADFPLRFLTVCPVTPFNFD